MCFDYLTGVYAFLCYTLPFTISSTFGYLFAAQVYRNSFVLFINYISFLAFRLKTVRSRFLLSTEKPKINVILLSHRRKEFDQILQDFYNSQMLFKIAPAFYIVAGNLISTITIYLGCFIVQELELRIFIISVAILIAICLTFPLFHINMLFMKQVQEQF